MSDQLKTFFAGIDLELEATSEEHAQAVVAHLVTLALQEPAVVYAADGGVEEDCRV